MPYTISASATSQTTPPSSAPRLPRPRGPISQTVIDLLTWPRMSASPIDPPALWARRIQACDPLGADCQLALHICYEMHHRGFAALDPDLEWDPRLLAVRRELESVFLGLLHAAVPRCDDVEGRLNWLTDHADGTPGDVAGHLFEHGRWEQVQELFMHRSIYHLKQAVPHAGGLSNSRHYQLYAELMSAAGLKSGYLAYLDCVPAESLAAANFMSMAGLHRSMVGRLVGLLAAAEITTPPHARRMVAALEKLKAPDPCRRFYGEIGHARGWRENALQRNVVSEFLTAHPDMAADVAFGIDAAELLNARQSHYILSCWEGSDTSLFTNLVA